MINRDQAATKYEFKCPYTGGETGIPPGTRTLGALMQELFGVATPEAFDCQITTDFIAATWQAFINTPLGNYSTSGSGALTQAYWRVVITDYKLVVHDDCSFTLTWSAIDAYLSLSGGAETHPLTYGAYTYNGAAGTYDERLNYTHIAPINSALDSAIGPIPCADILSSSSTAVFSKGGYRYEKPPGSGIMVTDPVLFDNTGAPGTCDCSIGLPTIGGANSYEVYASTDLTISITDTSQTNFTCTCDGGSVVHGAWYDHTRDLKLLSVFHVNIKSSNVFVGEHNLYDVWQCILNGVTTSGSGNTLSNPPSTICDSSRSAIHRVNRNTCTIIFDGRCLDYSTCSVPDHSYACRYEGEADLTWTTKPPCALSDKSPDNIHFVQSGEYVWAFIRNGDVYVAKSQFPIPTAGYVNLVQVTNTGNCDRPCLYIEPQGVFYVSYEIGGNIVFRFSTDYGATWSSSSIVFTGCIIPRTAIGTNGERVFAGFKYNSGSSGPGKIRIVTQSPGGTLSTEANALLWNGAANAAFDVKDTGYDLTFQNGSFIIICTKDGNTTFSFLSSKDYGSTYTDLGY